MEKELMEQIARIQGIAQTGLTYGKDVYDKERYQELQEIAKDLLKITTNLPDEKIKILTEKDEGYATPKVDIRAVVFDEQDRLLLVQEKKDHLWSLPGGWADIGFSPFEIAEKETEEEAGIVVKAARLLAVKDKSKHPYPPSAVYVYKFFIACRWVEGDLQSGVETETAAFFTQKEINELKLSLPRNTKEDIQMIFDDHKNPQAVWCE